MQPFSSLAKFSCEQPSVAQRVLQGLLQALQLGTSVLEGSNMLETRGVSARIRIVPVCPPAVCSGDVKNLVTKWKKTGLTQDFDFLQSSVLDDRATVGMTSLQI